MLDHRLGARAGLGLRKDGAGPRSGGATSDTHPEHGHIDTAPKRDDATHQAQDTGTPAGGIDEDRRPGLPGGGHARLIGCCVGHTLETMC